MLVSVLLSSIWRPKVSKNLFIYLFQIRKNNILVPECGPDLVEFFIERDYHPDWTQIFSGPEEQYWDELIGLIGQPITIALQGDVARLELTFKFPSASTLAQV